MYLSFYQGKINLTLMKIDLIMMNEKNFYNDNIKYKNKYKCKYKFDNDENIIKSFETVFKENSIEYNLYDMSKIYRIEYLLKKLEYNDRISKDLFNYFKNQLSNRKKITHKFLKIKIKLI